MNNLQQQIQYIRTCPDYAIFAIDLFCGAGGETTGIELAQMNNHKCAKVIACVNHDVNAIKSHAANHKNTLHYIEDIRTLNLCGLVELADAVRTFHPKSSLLLHASLECTNFSKAKGGQPRDADSRTLAEHLFRYIEAIDPDYIQIENVEEFMCWGELDENGKPVSKHKGSDYLRWVKHVQEYGYDYDWRLLNAADFGAYTSRKRFFGQFARKGLKIAFPEQTYAKNGDDGGMFTMYKKWKPVRDVLDLQDEGESIFTKRKPLCEKTLERIYAGLIKFVAGGKENFLLKWNSMKDGRYRAPSIDEPCPTLPCRNAIGVVKAQFLSKQFSGHPMSKNKSLDEPAGTITTIPHEAFVTAYYGNGFNSDIQEPMPTVPTKDRFGLVRCVSIQDTLLEDAVIQDPLLEDAVRLLHKEKNVSAELIQKKFSIGKTRANRLASFIVNYRFNNTGSSIDEPAPTICTVGQIGLANCQFLANEYSGGGQISDINKPSPSILTNPKQKIVSAQYLMNPQYASAGGSIDNPCFTLIARMDKMPPYLISTEQGVGIKIFDDDSEMTRKIKEFMAMYGIVDIKMRMLKIVELKRIMGFPEDYTLIGTQAEQKKFIGNAVEVNMSRVLCEALARKLMAA